MNKGICYIYGAGTYYSDSCPIPNKNDIVIAADGGYDFLKKINIRPHILMGDFDSLTEISDILIETITFPSRKDYTDMALAVNEGITRGYTTFAIYGGCGGRIDHTLANIQLLAETATKGCRAFLYADSYVITAIKDNSFNISDFPFITPKKSGYISVFSHSDISENVTISGLSYETECITLNNCTVLGTSNEYLNKPFTISVGCGTLIIAVQI